MNLETYARAQVARFCIEEAARFGGVSYMLTIACVLRNRTLAGWGSWIDVVQRAEEKRGCELPTQMVDVRGANIRTFLQKVDEIYSGRDEEDLSNGALWYTDSTQPQRQWFQDEILSNREEHPLVAQAPPLMLFQ
jgi:hypothetical protein